MKTLMILICGILIGTTAVAKEPRAVVYDFELISVVDGDTVKFKADFLPPPLKPVLSIRVYGVDTPEKGHRAACPQEAARGKAATNFTANSINRAQKTQIVLIGWDKYGGRVLGDVLLDGVSLRKLLIENGHAREYYGDKKQSWCE